MTTDEIGTRLAMHELAQTIPELELYMLHALLAKAEGARTLHTEDRISYYVGLAQSIASSALQLRLLLQFEALLNGNTTAGAAVFADGIMSPHGQELFREIWALLPSGEPTAESGEDVV